MIHNRAWLLEKYPIPVNTRKKTGQFVVDIVLEAEYKGDRLPLLPQKRLKMYTPGHAFPFCSALWLVCGYLV
jgi:hypothetical protein